MTNKQKIFIQVYAVLAIFASGMINYHVGLRDGRKEGKIARILNGEYHHYVFDYQNGEMITTVDDALIDDQKLTKWNMDFYTNSKLNQKIDRKPVQKLTTEIDALKNLGEVVIHY